MKFEEIGYVFSIATNSYMMSKKIYKWCSENNIKSFRVWDEETSDTRRIFYVAFKEHADAALFKLTWS